MGIAGLVYASRLRSISTNIDGGTLVLYAVAAAVIGGTSLFGGRGRGGDAVVGGIVVAAINNGMGLQGYSTAARLVVTAVVLVVAVTIDAVARKGRTTCVTSIRDAVPSYDTAVPYISPSGSEISSSRSPSGPLKYIDDSFMIS